VRECPAKAIKVEGGQAVVIAERCIGCGNCVKVCAQKAKQITDDTGAVQEMLASGERVFACLAPSFPAAFHPASPGRIIAAARALGFCEVWEVAFGAELVGRAYAELFKTAQRTGARVITTPCPAVVAYVEKHMPELHGALAPLVSPMIATGRAVRHRHGKDVRVVFIGPCIAKKNEILDPSVTGCVDKALTFKELIKMFREAGIEPEKMPESGPDGPMSRLARSFPISGGLLKTSGLSTDILENDVVVTEGKERVLAALDELASGRSTARLFDVLYCEGCINGPKMLNEMSVFARKEILANYVVQQGRFTTQREQAEAFAEFKDMDMHRSFTPQNLVLPMPSEEEIEKVLRATKKFTPDDHLNCGACGYHTCREKAIAVCQGLAEAEMCLPYLVDELGDTCERLKQSHEALENTQQRLIRTERLASMGQLSAGIAHEINNPLGTILLYSHLMLKHLASDNPQRPDVETIVSEATRCRNIVRGLLDFARQSRVHKAEVDFRKLMEDVRKVMAPKAEDKGVKLMVEAPGDLPPMMVDAAQVKQMLINLVDNGIDATERGGMVSISARAQSGNGDVVVEVRDTGCGMSREHQRKLFTPFFTTKEMGKGTGLGLAIAYGIVKMHSGDITADSEVGRGTVFTVRLPAGERNVDFVEAADKRIQADAERKETYHG